MAESGKHRQNFHIPNLGSNESNPETLNIIDDYGEFLNEYETTTRN